MAAAASRDTIAAPGHRNPNYIVVSVTDTNGTPIAGLTDANFKVDPVIVGPGARWSHHQRQRRS